MRICSVKKIQLLVIQTMEHCLDLLVYEALFCILKYWQHILRIKLVHLLQPSGRPQWFSNHLRGLVALVSSPRAGIPNMLLKPLPLLGGHPSLLHPPPLLGHPLEVQTTTPSLLPDSTRFFIYSLGCRRAILLVFGSFQREFLYVFVVLM